MSREVRYSLLIGAASFIPVPVADTWVQNRLRRRLVRGEARGAGSVLCESAVSELADEPPLDPRRLVTWPIRKVLGKVLLPFELARIVSETFEVASQARQLGEARVRIGGPDDAEPRSAAR